MSSSAPKPDRVRSVPLWAQTLADLQRRVAEGEFAEGVPPERELIAEYGVSRHTMRYAIGQLQSAGIVERGRGKGTFVTRRPIEQPTGILYSLFRSVEEQGFVQRSHVLDLGTRADANVAERLGLTAKAKLVYLHRVRFADDVPIAVDELWLPHSIAAPILEADFAHTSLYNELESRCGIKPGAGNERISPTIPTSTESDLLAITPGEPAFLIERTTEFRGVPLEWRRTIVRGDHFAFVTTWDAAGLGSQTSLASSRNAKGANLSGALQMAPNPRSRRNNVHI